MHRSSKARTMLPDSELEQLGQKLLRSRDDDGGNNRNRSASRRRPGSSKAGRSSSATRVRPAGRPSSRKSKQRACVYDDQPDAHKQTHPYLGQKAERRGSTGSSSRASRRGSGSRTGGSSIAAPDERIEDVKREINELKAAGEFDKVVELTVELVALTHILHGPRTLHMSRAYWALADAYMRRQLAEQALEHCKRSQQLTALLAVDDEEAAQFEPTVLLTLGMCYTMLSKFTEAARWLKRALKLVQDLHGEDHAGNVLIFLGLSNMCQAQKKWSAARDHLVEAWEIKENLCRQQDNSADGDNTELAEIYSEMGRVYMKLDNESDPEDATRETTALDMYQRALRIFSAKCPGTVAEGKTAQQVGTIQSKLGDFDGALVSFQLSSEVFSKLFGAHNKKTLDVWRKICLLLVKLKRFEEAETQLNQVLKAEKAVFGGSSTNIIETHKLLAMVYKVNGKRTDMIKQYETIQQIYIQNFGTKDKRTKQIAAQVCSLQLNLVT